jgi:hypothetical protein
MDASVYRVTLNWLREVHVLWVTARSERQALALACRRLAKLLGFNWRMVLMKFKCGDYKYEVRKEEDS